MVLSLSKVEKYCQELSNCIDRCHEQENLLNSWSVQVNSCFEFNCKVRRLSCHKFALVKLFWCLVIMWPRAVIETRLGWLKRKIIYFIFESESIYSTPIILNGEYSIRVAFYSFCPNITQIRFRYQWVIIDIELNIRFELNYCLSILLKSS